MERLSEELSDAIEEAGQEFDPDNLEKVTNPADRLERNRRMETGD